MTEYTVYAVTDGEDTELLTTTDLHEAITERMEFTVVSRIHTQIAYIDPDPQIEDLQNLFD